MENADYTHIVKWFQVLVCLAFAPIIPLVWIMVWAGEVIAFPLAVVMPFIVYHGTRIGTPRSYENNLLKVKFIFKTKQFSIDDVSWYMIGHPDPWNRSCPITLKLPGLLNYVQTMSDSRNKLISILVENNVRVRGVFHTPPRP